MELKTLRTWLSNASCTRSRSIGEIAASRKLPVRMNCVKAALDAPTQTGVATLGAPV